MAKIVLSGTWQKLEYKGSINVRFNLSEPVKAQLKDKWGDVYHGQFDQVEMRHDYRKSSKTGYYFSPIFRGIKNDDGKIERFGYQLSKHKAENGVDTFQLPTIDVEFDLNLLV